MSKIKFKIFTYSGGEIQSYKMEGLHTNLDEIILDAKRMASELYGKTGLRSTACVATFKGDSPPHFEGLAIRQYSNMSAEWVSV